MLYKLPSALRRSLAAPMGPLFEGMPAQSLPKAITWMQTQSPHLFDPTFKSSDIGNNNQSGIICVGDIISKGMLLHPELAPRVKYCFIDGETQRGSEVGIKNLKGIVEISIKNPRAMISDEAITFIRSHLRDGKQYFVKVIGEEDLLVIPAVIEAVNFFVFYGQPPVTDAGLSIPAGCVGLHSTPELREKLLKIFTKFEKIN